MPEGGQFWVVSYLVLWGLLISTIIVLLALARQIGLIHRRLPPSGARVAALGPAVGEVAPSPEVTDSLGSSFRWGHEEGKSTLILFISSRCPTCSEMAPAIRSIAKSENPTTRTVLVGLDDDPEDSKAYVRRNRLAHLPLLTSPLVWSSFGVQSTPYAILLDNQAVVRTKGFVNSIEHLETLFDPAYVEGPARQTIPIGAPGANGHAKGQQHR